MASIRWGMIGCGAVTEVKSGPAFQQAEGSVLVAVASRRLSAAEDYARRHAVPKVYADIDDLIAASEVDAVYIATPPDSHLELALRVAHAGKPCCVEKPMALDPDECDRMIAAFAARGLPLFVSYYRRSLPRFRQVKAWLDAGRIGAVRDVRWHLVKPASPRDLVREPNWRTHPATAPGGYFDDLASHGLDLLQFLLGDIEDACGVATNQQALYGAADAVSACWRFANGALGSGSWNFGGDRREDVVEILGQRGAIRFSMFDEAPLQLRAEGTEQSVSIANPSPIQIHHVAAMVRHLRGGAVHPSTGIEAAKTNRVMAQILQRRV
jgi:predicted dehydrogenase